MGNSVYKNNVYHNSFWNLLYISFNFNGFLIEKQLINYKCCKILSFRVTWYIDIFFITPTDFNWNSWPLYYYIFDIYGGQQKYLYRRAQLSNRGTRYRTSTYIVILSKKFRSQFMCVWVTFFAISGRKGKEMTIAEKKSYSWFLD